MEWRVISVDSFTDYQNDWDRLNESGPNSPVLNSSFVINSLDAFGTTNKKLAVFESNGEICAMGIFEKKNLFVWDTYQPSQAPLGLWISNSSFSIEEILFHLIKALPGIVLKVGITQQDPDLFRRPVQSNQVSTLDYIETARILVTETFDSYWASRGKNLRHNLKRQRNRLTKEGVIVSFEIIKEPDKVYDAITEYGELESSGWKSEHGTNIHIDNDQGKFYLNLIRKFCELGRGFICQYRYNGKLVACDLCIEQGNTLVILKTTYDETIKTTSPAFLMRKEMFERIFEEQRIERIEFYGKVMEWHTKWSDHIRTLYHLNYKHRIFSMLSQQG